MTNEDIEIILEKIKHSFSGFSLGFQRYYYIPHEQKENIIKMIKSDKLIPYLNKLTEEQFINLLKQI